MIRAAALAFLPILLWGCASLPPITVEHQAPGDVMIRGLRVETTMMERGCLSITVVNQSDLPAEVAARVPMTVVGMTRQTESRIVGYRDETVCIGETCTLVKVPINEETTIDQPVYGRFSLQPERLVLAPEETRGILVTLLDPGTSHTGFTLTVLLTVSDADGAETLKIAAAYDSQS